MSKGRKEIPIDLELLQETITKIEKGEAPPGNRTALWKAVAEVFPVKVSPQTLMNKAQKNNLSILTPTGKRGNNNIDALRTAPKKKIRRFKPEYESDVKEQFRQLGDKHLDKLLSGNLKAAVKSFCWDCMGESKKSVALCTSYACPLWPHRPWVKEEKKRGCPLPTCDNTELSEKLQSAEGGASPPSTRQDEPAENTSSTL